MDWAQPTLSAVYTSTLSSLNTKIDAVGKMFEGESHTNVPVGMKRFNPTTKNLERWDGTQFVEWDTRLKDHLANTSNPHNVTPGQIGAPTTAQFNSHVSNTNNPHNTTALQLGVPTNATFNAHVADTTKHPIAASQINGLMIGNNLSELAPTAGTARTNIGAAASADLTAHTSNVSNPHNLTRGQIGAAASGANGDITSLAACTLINNASNIQIRSTGGEILLYSNNNTAGWKLDTAGNLVPLVFPMTIGTISAGVGKIYFGQGFKNTGGVQTWSFFPYSDIGSLNPAAATLGDCANAINSIAKRLETLGLFN